MLTYIKNLYTKIFGVDKTITQGLTELDYIPLSEIKQTQKKKNAKQFPEVKASEPFVKTRTRKPKTVKDWEDNFDLGGNE